MIETLSNIVAIFITPNRGRFSIMSVIHQQGHTLFQPVSGFQRSNYDVKAVDLESNGILLGTFPIKAHDDQVLRKQIRRFDTCLIINKVTGERVDVIRFSEPYRIMGSAFFANPYVEHVSPSHSPSPPPGSDPLLDISGSLVEHVSQPAPKKQKVKSSPGSLLPPITHKKPETLSPFVAKQLLELAQLKKEMCPIIAEEFSAGHTAIMPCGHMFAQIAIKESFKKELGKCPACRQSGTPTYI